MNVSFDGMRKQATANMNNLQEILKQIIENNDLHDFDKEELVESFNSAAASVEMFNYLYDDEAEGDFNHLGGLETNRLSATINEED